MYYIVLDILFIILVHQLVPLGYSLVVDILTKTISISKSITSNSLLQDQWGISNHNIVHCRDRLLHYVSQSGNNILTRLDTAFSQIDNNNDSTETQRYVQDSIRRCKHELSKWIMEDNAIVYVCGYVTIANYISHGLCISIYVCGYTVAITWLMH